MEIVNLLAFLNKVQLLNTLDYATCDNERVNFLGLMNCDEQFIQSFNLGVIYVSQKTLGQFTIVDGLNRILSLSLLLHAICECYKKTTEKNDIAIRTIRTQYLLNDKKTKLRLPSEYQKIYDKIIFGERLSGREKETPMFVMLHKFWTQIKEENLQASDIFKMLKKFQVIISDTGNVNLRDLYFTLNKDKRDVNQLLLIENFLKDYNLKKDWEDIKHLYKSSDSDLKLFLKDFFITKLNNAYDEKYLYYYFINYFSTMLSYMSESVMMSKIKYSAAYYNDIMNVNFTSDAIKKAIIQIKIHGGEDTFAYLLSIYEDYKEGNLTEATLLEILSTIDEYLRNRQKNANNVEFNDLIKYLNAFITCK